MDSLSELWIVHPKPCEGELLSSWLTRIAKKHGQNLHSFCMDHWPDAQIWTRDIDLSQPQHMLATLSVGTGVSIETAQTTVFSTFSGVLFEGDFPDGKINFVRPIGVYHRTRRSFGMQYCSACLRGDSKPFFRLKWRLTGFPTCTTHRLILNNRCLICSSPIVLHKGGITNCHVCKCDLRYMYQEVANPIVTTLQEHNEQIFAGGTVSVVPSLVGMFPLAFFRLFHRLMLVTIFGTRAERLRNAIKGLFFCDLKMCKNEKEKEMGYVGPTRMHNAMLGVHYLLIDWPHNFVIAAKEAGLWFSWATKDTSLAELPYVYSRVVREHLSDPIGFRRHIQRLPKPAPDLSEPLPFESDACAMAHE